LFKAYLLQYKKKFQDLELNNGFWSASKAYTTFDFCNYKKDNIRDMDVDAFD
jgi:hypothetical protein